MKASEKITGLLKGEYNDLLADLYQDESLVASQVQRYQKALQRFMELYGDQDISIYSASGRSEISGNHTDHQHGKVLAAAINLDMIGIVSPQKDTIQVVSDDSQIKDICLNDLEKKEEEEGTSESLIRGVVYKLQAMGYQVGGFQAYITSDVLVGSGLSSSAAFEVLIGTIINGLYNQMRIDPVTIAQISQFAENVYFGKPCGLMDQSACSIGGLIHIDFSDPAQPIVNHLDVDFSQFHHSLCIVDTKGNHADLTNEYAAIPAEMKMISEFFGKEYLREVEPEVFYDHIAEIRKVSGDRGVLRALHFFEEEKRVDDIIQALNQNNFAKFKSIIAASGNSSYKYLQNVYASSDPQNQAVSLGLALSERILKEHGVCRVHGGGFAGTIQAFVENGFVDTYKKEIEKVFGEGSCHVLKIRKYGGCQVLE